MIRIGIIGTGTIVKEFVKTVESIKNKIVISCLYSRTLERAKNFQNENNLSLDIKIVTKYKDMIKNIDAVYIASPNGLHYEQAKFFLQSGKHVLLEKPTCFLVNELQELQILAMKKKCILLEAFKTIYLPNYYELKKQVELIEPIVANFQWNKYSSRMENVLQHKYESVFDNNLGKGTLYDALIYPVELAISLFGPVNKVTAVAQTLKNNVHITDVINLIHKNNIITNIVCTKAASGISNSEIIGINETLIFSHLTQIESLQKFYWLITKLLPLNKNTNILTMMYEIDFFIDLINKKNFLLMNKQLELSLAALAVLEEVSTNSYNISFK